MHDLVIGVAVAVQIDASADGGAGGTAGQTRGGSRCLRAQEGGAARRDGGGVGRAEGNHRAGGYGEGLEHRVVEVAITSEVSRGIGGIGPADEDVGDPVRVARDEVGGVAHEGHEAAVGRNGDRFKTDTVSLGVVGGDAHPLGGARQPVMDEGVISPDVGVARHEVGGRAGEGHEAAVGGGAGRGGAPVALRAG